MPPAAAPRGFTMTTPLVDSPFFDEDLSGAPLDEATKDLLRQFREQGYLELDLAIPGFDALAAEIVERLQRDYGGQRRLLDAWVRHDAVRRLACEPRVLELLARLYGRRPVPFQTLNFPVGTQQRTHSDVVHFHSVPARFMCGVWFALEDCDGDNGPLHYYPGSHRLPLYDLHDIGLAATFDEDFETRYTLYEDFVERLMKAQGIARRELHVKKGRALLWAANLFHGGCEIRDPRRTRHSQVTHYFFEDCIYYTPLLSDAGIDRRFLRKIVDISTGRPARQAYLGREVEVLQLGRAGYRVIPGGAGAYLASRAGGLFDVVRAKVGRVIGGRVTPDRNTYG